MKQAKKISFGFLFVFAILLFSFGTMFGIPNFANAEGTNEEIVAINEAKIGDTEYETLSAAFENALTGETVTLLKDVTLEQGIKFPKEKNLTFDLNNKIVTINNKYISVEDSTTSVSIINGTIKNTYAGLQAPSIFIKAVENAEIRNVVIDNASNYGIYLNGAGTVEISDCTITAAMYGICDMSKSTTTISNCKLIDCSSYGLFVMKSGETTISNTQITGTDIGIGNFGITGDAVAGPLNVNDCTIVSKFYGITGNGTDGCAVTDITVNNTSITSEYYGIYHPQDGTLEINGGKIDAGSACVEIRAGNLTINDNAVLSVPTNVEYETNANGNGTSVVGAAVAISQHTTNKAINVTINSAVLSAKMALTQVDLQNIEQPNEVSIAVNDGTFKGNIYSERLNKFIKGGNFSVQPSAEYLLENAFSMQDEQGNFVVTTDVEQSKKETTEFIKFYAAAKNVKYTSEIDSIINNKEVSTMIGVSRAKSEAMAKIDEIYELLAQKKREAIDEIKLAAMAKEATGTQEALDEVVVPTAIFVAVNSAVDENQIEEIKLNALAEINDIREYRKQIKQNNNESDNIINNSSTSEGDANSSKNKIDTAKLLERLERNNASLNGLYVILSLALAFSVCAFVVVFMNSRKKKTNTASNEDEK